MTRRSCELRGVTKFYGDHEVLRGHRPGRPRGPGGRADRRLRLGQVDAAALHRPARGDRRRRHLPRRRPDHRSRAPTRSRSAAASGSSSRPTTCSRTARDRQRHPGRGARAADAGGRGAAAGQRDARALRPRRPRARLSRSPLRRPAAAGRDRPRADDRPRALLLDEVTSALDPELVGEVLTIIPRAQVGRHDDADRHPRDGLRARLRRRGLLTSRTGGSSSAARPSRSSATRRRPRYPALSPPVSPVVTCSYPRSLSPGVGVDVEVVDLELAAAQSGPEPELGELPPAGRARIEVERRGGVPV